MVRMPVDDHVERFGFAAMKREPLRLPRVLGLPSECLEDEVNPLTEEVMVAP